jgi:hypothetical protein
VQQFVRVAIDRYERDGIATTHIGTFTVAHCAIALCSVAHFPKSWVEGQEVESSGLVAPLAKHSSGREARASSTTKPVTKSSYAPVGTAYIEGCK